MESRYAVRCVLLEHHARSSHASRTFWGALRADDVKIGSDKWESPLLLQPRTSGPRLELYYWTLIKKHIIQLAFKTAHEKGNLSSRLSTDLYNAVNMNPAKVFDSSQYMNDGKVHILLAASGSVATIKLPLIARALAGHVSVSVRIIITQNARNFLQGQADEQPVLDSLTKVQGIDGIYYDPDEWSKPWVRGDKILHIELRRWAHMLLVAPLSANTMAKMANGISDNLLLSVIRAWDTTGMVDMRRKYIMIAPAMNTAMWRHPITNKHLKNIQQDWIDGEGSLVTVLKPIEKELACGDTGDGAMMDWNQIVGHVADHLKLEKQTNSGP